jgi:hypothetical protein
LSFNSAFKSVKPLFGNEKNSFISCFTAMSLTRNCVPDHCSNLYVRLQPFKYNARNNPIQVSKRNQWNAKKYLSRQSRYCWISDVFLLHILYVPDSNPVLEAGYTDCFFVLNWCSSKQILVLQAFFKTSNYLFRPRSFQFIVHKHSFWVPM